MKKYKYITFFNSPIANCTSIKNNPKSAYLRNGIPDTDVRILLYVTRIKSHRP